MEAINRAVEKYEKMILEAERRIWSTPETGFREVKSSEYLAERFRELGYSLTMAGDIPGFYTVVDTGREGPEVLVLGELDSIICPNHPESDPETGAVHSCGHHAQCAALLGVAAALREPGVLDRLVGRIRLCAVPAEELLEIEYRRELMKQGKIRYFGGKTEYLYRGYFDSVDLAFMVHTSNRFTARTGGSVGCIAKNVIYKGRAAHAGGSPHLGCNALYAANCGLSAINALRETFRETDLIRVHPIVTAGGAIVNAIPDCVTIESYVRGRTVDAIKRANDSVNRALIGAALSLGANVEIIDMPGYAPHINGGVQAGASRGRALYGGRGAVHDRQHGYGRSFLRDAHRTSLLRRCCRSCTRQRLLYGRSRASLCAVGKGTACDARSSDGRWGKRSPSHRGELQAALRKQGSLFCVSGEHSPRG